MLLQDFFHRAGRLTMALRWGWAGILAGGVGLTLTSAPLVPAVTVVAFGDSTTAPRQGIVPYPGLLQPCLAKKGGPAVTVINAGVKGDTTTRARARFERDVLARDPGLVIIQFGLNDSAIDVWKTPPAAGPRVALADYEANLAWFVAELRRRGVAVVLMTPNRMQWTPGLLKQYGRPPYDSADPDGFNLLVRPYAAAVRRLAQAADVPLVDVLRLHDETAGTSSGSLLLDGMHPNQPAHARVAGLLADLLRDRPDLLGAARRGPPVPPDVR